MKTLRFDIILTFFLFSFVLFINKCTCNNSTPKIILNYSKTDSLSDAYKYNNYKMFFELFPKTFEEFVDYYDYNEKSGKMPLYDLYELHINYLFDNSDMVDSIIFTQKLIRIAVKGKWDADAISLFQKRLTQYILSKTYVFIEILNKETDFETRNLWLFIFDGSPKDDKQIIQRYNRIYSKICLIDQKQANLLGSVFEEEYKIK